MIAIYTKDLNFKNFAQKSLLSIGIIPLIFDENFGFELLKPLKINNFLIFIDDTSRSSAEKMFYDLQKAFPSSGFAVAVKIHCDSPSNFREIEGIGKQITLPCDEEMFKQLILRHFNFADTYGVLKFMQRGREALLLGYPISLSEKEFFIVKILTYAKECAVPKESLSKLLNISENSLSVHICNINKKAFSITGRKLIIYKEHGYILNPNM